MSVSQNITVLKHLLHKMKEDALKDPLTKLLNRRGFDQAIQNACDEAVYSQGGFALVVVDLDELKMLNDTLGHRVGDAVIQFVGQFLKGWLRPQEIAARIGGDEFYLLLQEGQREGLEIRLDELRKVVDQGLRMPDVPFAIMLSIGGSVWQPGDDPYEVLSAADTAMYAEKGIHRLLRNLKSVLSAAAA